MCAQIHTAWFRKPDSEPFSCEVMALGDSGVEDIRAAFADNSHFIGVVSPDQTEQENEATLRKVGSPIPL